MSDIITFAILTAKRQGEITRLLWPDLNAEKKTALLRDAKHPRAKLGNHRIFPLIGDAWELVQRQPRTPGEDRILLVQLGICGNVLHPRVRLAR